METKFYALTKELAELKTNDSRKSGFVNADLYSFSEVILLNSTDKNINTHFNALCTTPNGHQSLQILRKGNEKYEVWNQPETEQKEESLFRVGDRVFDYSYGWGFISKIINSSSFPIYVLFEKFKFDINYTSDGFFTTDIDNPRLSFTEYNFRTGGFSQVRPKPEPKVGDIGYFWDEQENIDARYCYYGELTDIYLTNEDSKYEYANGESFKYFSNEKPF